MAPDAYRTSWILKGALGREGPWKSWNEAGRPIRRLLWCSRQEIMTPDWSWWSGRCRDGEKRAVLFVFWRFGWIKLSNEEKRIVKDNLEVPGLNKQQTDAALYWRQEEQAGATKQKRLCPCPQPLGIAERVVSRLPVECSLSWRFSWLTNDTPLSTRMPPEALSENLGDSELSLIFG